MKVFSAVVKILVALAAIAGAAYLLATYGEKLVAWAKKVCPCCEEPQLEDVPAVEEVEEPVVEPVEEVEEVEIPAEDPVAEEQDFVG